MLGPVVCTLLLLIATAVALSGASRDERRIILAGLAAHSLGSVAFVVYHERIYHGGDMFAYTNFGRDIALLVQRDSRYFVDLVKLAFQRENDIGLPYFSETSSGSMCAFTALVTLLVGDNRYVVCLAISVLAFLGFLAIYRALAPELHAIERKPFLVALMLVPSVVFWTAGATKEAFVIVFLGLVYYGLAGLRRRRLLSVPALAVGVVGVALTKAYVLIALTVGIAGWLYAARSVRLGTVSKILALIVGVGGMLLVTHFFPQYGSGLATTVRDQQAAYDLVQGQGTGVELGDTDQDADTATLASQVRFLPLALMNALARPSVFDVRNATSLLAALEMTVVLLLIASLLRGGVRRIGRELRGRPPLMFAAVFVLSFSIGVGLTTRNLGSLSRYRTPAFPLYIGLVAALRARLATPQTKHVPKVGRRLPRVNRRAA